MLTEHETILYNLLVKLGRPATTHDLSNVRTNEIDPEITFVLQSLVEKGLLRVENHDFPCPPNERGMYSYRYHVNKPADIVRLRNAKRL
ncbi:MAG: hypothetical protein R3213_06940 [Flavobacteriaceae bacterium]|nr:hypothetical protein [Flavobacteriaceae bacterium]